VSARIRVALLFGGRSVEHEVSVVSARGVFSALDRDRFECLPVGVTGEGAWLPPELSERILRGEGKRVESPEADGGADRVVVDPGGGGLLQLGADGRHRRFPVDVAFPVVHGWGGEDGRFQGLLDLAGIPCVGSGVLGSALAMDKDSAKSICLRAGLPVGAWVLVTRDRYRRAPAEVLDRVARNARFPAFVKPANGGSSVGVSRVTTPEELPAALDAAFDCDRRVLVEDVIDALEIECAVLGNDRPEASLVGEIVPSREFYDYSAKYLDGASRLLIPAPLDPATVETVRRLAVEVFRVLDLAGFARVDFFLDRNDGRVYVNEANTLPGFTPISMYPKLWEASGVPYGELLARLVGFALERGADERGRRTRWRSED
jgi:D-alanine-D-alanine ligase